MAPPCSPLITTVPAPAPPSQMRETPSPGMGSHYGPQGGKETASRPLTRPWRRPKHSCMSSRSIQCVSHLWYTAHRAPEQVSPFLAVPISSSVQRELSFISMEAARQDGHPSAPPWVCSAGPPPTWSESLLPLMRSGGVSRGRACRRDTVFHACGAPGGDGSCCGQSPMLHSPVTPHPSLLMRPH